MELHELQHHQKSKTSRSRVGRGGKRGTYAGRGMKGQKARSGTRFMPIVREILKRYPKLRGVKGNVPRTPRASINVRDLAGLAGGTIVTPDLLVEQGVVERVKGRIPPVKILGDGEISAALRVEGCQMTASAREKIEQAGGSAVLPS